MLWTQAEAGRKPGAESRDSVLSRSSATVILAENDPEQLNPDVVRSSGGSSWDDVAELESGRTRSLLLHWKSTEQDAAQPKTSTTRYHKRRFNIFAIFTEFDLGGYKLHDIEFVLGQGDKTTTLKN